MLDAE